MTWKKWIMSIALCLCALLCAASVRAEAADHSHPICGETHKDIGDHTGTCSTHTWTAWNGTDSINYDKNGVAYVYLSANVTLKNTQQYADDAPLTVESGKTLYLCLNDKKITQTDEYANAAIVVSGHLILCDCEGGGTVVQSDINKGMRGVTVKNGGEFTMYGGTITNNGGGVQVESGGKFTLYGGKITKNTNRGSTWNYGGGVTNSGTFIMYDGEITENAANYSGGVSNGGTFTMSGGVISKNKATSEQGGGVYNGGKFTMSGGTITGNIAKGNGGGVYNYYSSTFNISGDITISGNKKGTDVETGTDNNVCLLGGQTITIAGELKNTTPIGVTTSSTPSKDGNTKSVNITTAVETSKADQIKWVKAAISKLKYENNDTPIVTHTYEKAGYGEVLQLVACVHDSYEDTWTSDETNHWHKCQSCDTKKDEAQHGIFWTPASCAAPKTCSVCGKTQGEALQHPICGLTCTHEDSSGSSTHDPVPWTGWSGGDITYDVNGVARISLSDNVTLTSPLTVENKNTLYLCLNGKTLSSTGTETNTKTIYVKDGGKLFVCDCSTDQKGKITKTGTGGYEPACIYVSENSLPNGGVFTLFSGTVEAANGVYGVVSHDANVIISGGKVTSTNKNAIYFNNSQGSFTMTGGEVAATNADGIQLSGSSLVVKISGGSITSSIGYGIEFCHNAKAVYLSGTPSISGTTAAIYNGLWSGYYPKIYAHNEDSSEVYSGSAISMAYSSLANKLDIACVYDVTSANENLFTHADANYKFVKKAAEGGKYNLITRAANVYELTFDPNGGAVTSASQLVTYNEAYGELPTPTRSGYQFLGWFTDRTGGTKVGSTTTVSQQSDHTLYAHWAVIYTVTLNGNGGSGGTSLTSYVFGEGATLPTDWTKQCAIFAGWYDAETGGSEVTAISATDTGNKTFYARWTDNHTWDEGKVTTEPKCEETGEKTFTCKTCSATKTETINASGHKSGTAVRENEIAATCTAEGSYDEVVYCTECGDEVSRTHKTIGMIDHVYNTTKWVEFDANQHGHKCTKCDAFTDLTNHTPDREAATETEAKICTGCGCVMQAALGHTDHWVLVPVKPATCTEKGVKEHYECKGCGHKSVTDGVYTVVSDAELLTPIDPDNHTWQPATCTAPKTCAACHATDGAALGHDWSAWVVTTPATKDAPGVETRTCTRDAAHTQTRSIPKLGTSNSAAYSVSEDTEIRLEISEVDGLDALLSRILEKEENKELIRNGQNVDVSLIVKNTASSGVSEKIKEKLAGSNLVGLRLELTVERTVTANGAVESKTTIPDTVEPLRTTITLPAELQGKSGYVVYRLHGENVDVLTETANNYGEYISVSADKTQITICARLYSEYVVAYQTGGSSGGGYYPATSTSVKATSANTGDAGVLLYGVTAALSLTGTAWLGTKSKKR